MVLKPKKIVLKMVDYDLSFRNEDSFFSFRATLKELLGGSSWEGSRRRDGTQGWDEVLGADGLITRPYVQMVWNVDLTGPVRATLFEERIVRKYGPEISDSVRSLIEANVVH
jgi:hypothetical protein